MSAKKYTGVELMPGAVAHVTKDVKPETLAALKELAKLTVAQYSGETEVVVFAHFFVTGEPTPKQSFRAGGRNGGHADPRVVAWQNVVGWQAKAAVPPLPGLLECALAVDLDFHLGNKRRVDLDNLSKGVLDALKGVLFVDDSQVIELHLRKFISPGNSGVQVTIKPAEKEAGPHE